MDLSTLSLGLGGSAVGSIVIGIIAYFVARGFKSNCVAGGVSVALDIHKVTSDDKKEEPPRQSTNDSVTIEITPHLTPATPVNHVPHIALPPPHPVKTPKPKRESKNDRG